MACSDGRLLERALAGLAVVYAAGCASLPQASSGPPPFPGVPPARDLRAEYRAATCARFPPGFPDCELVLLKEPGEWSAAQRPSAAEATGKRYRIGLVPGLFAECLAPVARAFGDVEAGLRGHGFDVFYLAVAGRGTAEHNAAQIAAGLRTLPDDSRPLILVTYSKGLTDTLEYLVRNPGGEPRVAAIISIAGAANGSPLADAYRDAYRQWLARIPLPGCAKSDGSEIDDLLPEARRAWWARNAAAVKVPVFSLVTAPRDGSLSIGLQRAHAALSAIDTRNDGKVLWYDQLVPGGYLLGFLNADHWAVATPLTDSMPLLAFLFRDNLPRTALVEGAIEVAVAVLAREGNTDDRQIQRFEALGDPRQ